MIVSFASAKWPPACLLCLVLWLAPGVANGQSAELRDAFIKFSTLYGQGQYELALPYARRAATLGEQEFGSDHAHAIADCMKVAPTMGKEEIILVNLSGRGDKDLDSLRKASPGRFGGSR